MAVVGFNLNKISVERKDVLSGKVKITSKADITDIKKDKIEMVKGKDVLRFDFSYLVFYEPDMAKLDFQGYVLVLEEPNKVKEILKDWKKKKVDPSLKQDIFNLLLKKCTVKAFGLEEDLNLPTHFPLPQISAEAK